MATGEDGNWSIGVDFGTAFSKAALTRHENQRLITALGLKLGQAAGWTQVFVAPSILFLDGQKIFFGPRALACLANHDRERRELASSLKTMLGARSYQETLDYFPRRSVDPDRAFRVKELIILYLAYLLCLIDAAMAQIPGAPKVEQCRMRFCRPGWLPDQMAAAHEFMQTLFEQAHAIRAECGALLLGAQGLDYAVARQALDRAQAPTESGIKLDGGIYEASAVALCYFEDVSTPDRIVIVDVGAGTTDVAGLVKVPLDGAIKVVRSARRTIDIAGDYFDAALLDLLVGKAKKLKGNAQKSGLWRALSADVRALKEQVFKDGEISITACGQSITCSAKELERHPIFRQAVDEIAEVFGACLSEAAKDQGKSSMGRIGVLLAGGGANIPALRDAIEKRCSRSGVARLQPMAHLPAWVGEHSSAGELGSVFPQLSAACGAALSRDFGNLRELSPMQPAPGA